jgi:putative endonuclease
LSRRGYRIDARNVRWDGVEIDLIARRGMVVAFVEVKTRRSNRFGAPELAVDRRKQKRMIRAATAWRAQHPGFAPRIRFDVVSVRVENTNGRDRWQIEHFVAAFDASD